jgi:hypothetical protein
MTSGLLWRRVTPRTPAIGPSSWGPVLGEMSLDLLISVRLAVAVWHWRISPLALAPAHMRKASLCRRAPRLVSPAVLCAVRSSPMALSPDSMSGPATSAALLDAVLVQSFSLAVKTYDAIRGRLATPSLRSSATMMGISTPRKSLTAAVALTTRWSQNSALERFRGPEVHTVSLQRVLDGVLPVRPVTRAKTRRMEMKCSPSPGCSQPWSMEPLSPRAADGPYSPHSITVHASDVRSGKPRIQDDVLMIPSPRRADDVIIDDFCDTHSLKRTHTHTHSDTHTHTRLTLAPQASTLTDILSNTTTSRCYHLAALSSSSLQFFSDKCSPAAAMPAAIEKTVVPEKQKAVKKALKLAKLKCAMLKCVLRAAMLKLKFEEEAQGTAKDEDESQGAGGTSEDIANTKVEALPGCIDVSGAIRP